MTLTMSGRQPGKLEHVCSTAHLRYNSPPCHYKNASFFSLSHMQNLSDAVLLKSPTVLHKEDQTEKNSKTLRTCLLAKQVKM